MGHERSPDLSKYTAPYISASPLNSVLDERREETW